MVALDNHAFSGPGRGLKLTLGPLVGAIAILAGMLVLGAILTTQEVFTQIVMAVVLQVLFEVAVWIAWYWERQEKRRGAISV